jgi:isopentenyl diphosphate isomerase/L-lactate dehydrogenase-like FMN-dependent dehydrogenase
MIGAWFAAYQSPNAAAIHGMVDRVANARFSVFVLTSDVPVGSNREADARNGFSFPVRPGLKLSLDVATHPRWFAGVLGRTFRRGTDILKALALGAQCVFVGRPFLYAAAYAGEAGVSHAITLLAKEIDKDVALLGRRNIGEIGRDMVTEARR